jgi:hypothetical protein
VLCLRHCRWTTGSQQPSLAGQPEILAANRSYRRLARAHGREPTRKAFLAATWVLDEWRDRQSWDYVQSDGFSRRMRVFLGPKWSVHITSPLADAARYPQVVALTRLLASPYWMGLAARDHLAAGRPDPERRELLARQLAEYRRTVFLTSGEFADPYTPERFVHGLAATYLRLDGPTLGVFLAEVRRTVEPRYEWLPYPKKFLLDDLQGSGPYDPLVDLIQDHVKQEHAKAGCDRA